MENFTLCGHNLSHEIRSDRLTHQVSLISAFNGFYLRFARYLEVCNLLKNFLVNYFSITEIEFIVGPYEGSLGFSF